MITAKITEKGQITLPRSVRQALNVKPGERVQFVVGDQSVVLRPAVPSRAAKLAGSLRQYARPGEHASQIRSQVRKEVGRVAAHEG